MRRHVIGKQSIGRVLAVPLLAVGLTVSGCASNLGGGTYSRSSVGNVQHSARGTLVSVRHIQIEGTKSGVGTATGAVLGGAAGSEIGQGDAAKIAGVLGGAVLGGLLGSAVERGATQRAGYEYVVREPNGDLITIVQEADGSAIAAGSPVLVIYGDRARVVPDTTYYNDTSYDRDTSSY